MIVLYIIYVLIMFIWCNSIRISLYEVWDENKKEDKLVAKILVCIAGSAVDVMQFMVVVLLLYAIKKV